MARSKSDSYLTAAERDALTYLSSIGLRGCVGCMHVRRGDLFKDDGTCLWCHDEMTPEIEARVEGEKLLVKKLRKKLERIKSKGKPNLRILKPLITEEQS